MSNRIPRDELTPEQYKAWRQRYMLWYLKELQKETGYAK